MILRRLQHRAIALMLRQAVKIRNQGLSAQPHRGAPPFLCVPKTTHAPKLRFRALLSESVLEVELALT